MCVCVCVCVCGWVGGGPVCAVITVHVCVCTPAQHCIDLLVRVLRWGVTSAHDQLL